MRPGSPVKPLRPAVNGTVNIADAPQVKVLPVPGSVWVALAVFTKAVAVNTRIADQPMTGGRDAIFSRPAAQMEERLNCQILAVGTQADADQAVAAHRAANPGLNADYTVTEHTVGFTPEPAPPVAAQHTCIDCPSLIPPQLTRCQPCQARYWQACREADPEL